jgi:hypothetical protein
LLFAIFVTFATCTSANDPGAEEQKKVQGSAFLDSFFDPGQEVHDAVKLRYKCQVVENQCGRPDMWKIIFMFHFLQTPGNPKPYEIQSNLYTWKFAYPHLAKRNIRGEIQGLRNLAGESSLFLSVPDNHKDKRTGARSHAPEMFPTLDQEIDGFKDLWKREQVSQVNVTGKTLSIEIARQGIASDLRDWSVHGEMPAGKYRIWTATAAWGDSSYKVDFLVPDEGARYFSSLRPTQIATEAFFVHPGLFKAFFWDIEIQREHRTVWEPIRKWKLIESDAKAEENTWGMKLSNFEGRPAIEVSNDGSRTYARKSEIIELK